MGNGSAINPEETIAKKKKSSKIPVKANSSEIYKKTSKRLSHKQKRNSINGNGNEEEIDQNFNRDKESKIGKRLTGLTTKRVIVLVLFLIVLVPCFSLDYWNDPILSYEIGMLELKVFFDMNVSNANMQKLYNEFVASNVGLKRYPLVTLQVPNFPNATFSNEAELRTPEKRFFEMDWGNNLTARVVVDYSVNTQTNAIINIVRTCYICIIFAVAALFFSKDVNQLALRPIERMIQKVERISKNPLASKEVNIIRKKDIHQFETLIIENAIIKIGKLLALGFGDAGSEIIAQNIAQDGEDINPMIMGRKTWAVFGFCDIRNFTDTTEVLQEEVMVFVNTIAEVVHHNVDKYGGSANKNIGDAFLLVWKIRNTEIKRLSNSQLKGKKTRTMKNICDLALFSFLKVIIAINSKPNLLAYRKMERLNERLPHYKVNMGFGLHFGWAIEGAIGSIFKIDASYLSPNVNMASRLEAATKQFGVPILLSEEIYCRLSNSIQRQCREIDRVTVKGSNTPLSLYTYDIDISKVKPTETKIRNENEVKRRKRKRRTLIYSDYVFGEEKASFLYASDKILNEITLGDCQLIQEFKLAYKDYLEGRWGTCKALLNNILTNFPNDGPSKSLFEFIKQNNFSSPSDWKGFRVLTEK